MPSFDVAEVIGDVLGESVANKGGSGQYYELFVGTFAPTVVHIRGREELSKPFSFSITATYLAEAPLLDRGIVGLAATLLIHLPGKTTRVVQGVVSALGPVGGVHGRGLQSYEIRLVPRLALLKWRRDSRVFQNMTVPDIVESVLTAGRVPSRSALTRDYPVRAYCLQYQETDLQFVQRLLAEEGIYYWFEHPSGALADLTRGALSRAVDAVVPISDANAAPGLVETVVLADTPDSYPALDGGAPTASLSVSAAGVSANVGTRSRTLAFREHQGHAAQDDDDVHSFSRELAVRPGALTLRDYDFRRPLLPLVATASLPMLAAQSNADFTASTGMPGVSVTGSLSSTTVSYNPPDLEIYSHRGDYEETDVDDQRAHTQLNQHRRDRHVARGTSHCRNLLPGIRFTLDAGEGPFSGEYVVTRIDHEGTSPEFLTDKQVTYENRFQCVPAFFAYRPKRPKPVIRQVLESAVVVGPAGEEIYTDSFGRIKIQFHWDRGGGNNEFSSCWVRVVQTWSGAGWGTQFIPRIGMEVMVSFLNGDQDCPVVLGCVPNAIHPSPFILPGDKTRSGIKTESSPGGGGFNELSFEDAKAQEQIFLHAQRDLDEVVERNHTLVVHGSETTRIDGAQTSTVVGDRLETTKGNLEEQIEGDASRWVEGNSIDVVSGNADDRVEGDLTTRVGHNERRTIVGKLDLETLDDATHRSQGCLTTLVGKADANRSYTLRVEGLARVSSSKDLELSSDKAIVLRVGKSTIRITEDKIEIQSPAIAASGDGAGLTVADDTLKLSAKKAAIVTADSMLLKSEEGSVALAKEVKVDGKKILLNSPSEADDEPPPEPKEPTKIELKDRDGNPIAYQRYLIKLADGGEISGMVDEDGKAELEVDGDGEVSFPDLTESASA
jgi:type VI secretion system secreted protein VgrG